MQLLVTQVKNTVVSKCKVATENIILLHGLFGNLSNWKQVEDHFHTGYKIWAPSFPLFENSLRKSHLNKLVDFLENYIKKNDINRPVLVGNSLGGHVALLYALKHPNMVKKLVLTGSSGLYENTFGGSFPRVKDLAYIRTKVEDVFERKEVVDDAMVQYVFNIVQEKLKVISVIGLARDAQKQNLKDRLNQIKTPTLLIWGLQDKVTPPDVAQQFFELLPNATLHFIDQCGHAPMMEQPEIFNKHLAEFLAI